MRRAASRSRRRLQERLDIPVFHDDQHGTAIVVLAALENAARLIDRPLSDLRVVVSGAGAAGVAVTKILLEAGIGDIAVGDSKGIIHAGRGDLERHEAADRRRDQHRWADGLDRGGHARRRRLHRRLGRQGVRGALWRRCRRTRWCSRWQTPSRKWIQTMAAKYAKVVATGRSDYPNQINNVLAFPGIFKGALEVGATQITKGMKLAAANALAELWATTSPSTT